MSRPELVYAYDPLCGWCYGFHPELDKVRAALEDRVHWSIVCGGLATGSHERPIGETSAYIRRGVADVEKRTGVKFGEPFLQGVLDRGLWVSRSEPGCRAVLTIQRLWSDKVFPFAEELSRAFYRDGLVPDGVETMRTVAERVGFEPATLLAEWDTPSARRTTQEHMAATRALGVTVYPSLFIRREDGLSRIFEGWRDATGALALIESVLRR